MDTEEKEKKGKREERARTTIKGSHTGGVDNNGDDNGNDNGDEYEPTLPPETVAESALSDLETAIPFVFRGEDSVATAVDTPISHFPSSPRVIS